MGYTFDGPNSLIILTTGTTAFDVDDLYSRWVDWVALSDNAKFLPAIRTVGGDPLPGSKALGITFFLMNGWRIRPYEGNHSLFVNGNLYTEEGSTPFIPTLGAYNIMVISAVSSLVDSTIQQLPEIEAASFQGGVTIDTLNGTDGTDYPIGTPGTPCKTIPNALAISVVRGLRTLYVIGAVTIDSSDLPAYDGGKIVGYNHRSSHVTVNGVTFTNTEFEECEVSGVFGNGSNISVKNGVLHNTENTTYDAHFCSLKGTIKFDNVQNISFFVDCFTGDENGDTTYLDFSDSPMYISMHRLSGKVELQNMNNVLSSISTINCAGAKVTVSSTCTTGAVKVRGVAELVDNSAGTLIDSDTVMPTAHTGTPTAIENAAAVWGSLIETGYTAEQCMRLFASVLLGKVSGAGTGNETFRSLTDEKNRILATIDSNGNRTSITLDAV